MVALGPRRLVRVFTLAVAMPAIVAASSHNTAASTITAPQDADGTLSFPDIGVTLMLPKLDSLTRGTPTLRNGHSGGVLRGAWASRWTGYRGAAQSPGPGTSDIRCERASLEVSQDVIDREARE